MTEFPAIVAAGPSAEARRSRPLLFKDEFGFDEASESSLRLIFGKAGDCTQQRIRKFASNRSADLRSTARRCRLLGADHLAARGVHRGKRDIAVDHAQCVLDHLAAVVDLGDDASALCSR